MALARLACVRVLSTVYPVPCAVLVPCTNYSYFITICPSKILFIYANLVDHIMSHTVTSHAQTTLDGVTGTHATNLSLVAPRSRGRR